MPVRQIIIAPDRRLTTKTSPVAKGEGADIVQDLCDTLAATDDGIGLAAPQIGILKRVTVIQVDNDGRMIKPMVLMNPIIEYQSTELYSCEEGCLSFPGCSAIVERPSKVTLSYYDQQWDQQYLQASGLLAICLQHECDHLDGILFIDYLSKIRQQMLWRKVRKIKRVR